MKKYNVIILLAFIGCISCKQNNSGIYHNNDPLPSWNETATKKNIIQFVNNVTAEESATFIPVSERIAVFDNDGTLWCEQPLYFEMRYSLDVAEDMLKNNPALSHNPNLKILTDKNLFKKHPEQAMMEAFALSHANITEQQAASMAKNWLDTAKHDRFGVKYTELTYVPMIELLQYLQANQFKTYIVSGGSSIFIRQFSPHTYNIPKEQVIGSMLKAQFTERNNTYEILFQPEIWLNNDKEGKPEAIAQIIGKKPVLAFGNSDGDLQMLQWTASNTYPSMCLILHHTDAAREYAYDSTSTIGTLKNALTESIHRGWTIVDMQKDFKKIFAFEQK